MNLNELLESPSAWLSRIESDGIVLTSRVRLARNLKTAMFPAWGSLEDCQQIWALLEPVLTRVVKSYGDNLSLEFAEIDEMDRKVRQLEIERAAIKREKNNKKLKHISEQIANAKEKLESLNARWQNEKEIVDTIQNIKDDELD